MNRRAALGLVIGGVAFCAVPISKRAETRRYMSYVDGSTESITKYLKNIHCMRTYAQYDFGNKSEIFPLNHSTSSIFRSLSLEEKPYTFAWACQHAVKPDTNRKIKEAESKMGDEHKFKRYIYTLTNGITDDKTEDDIVFTPIKADDKLDLTVLFAEKLIDFTPYTFGDSDCLREGNVVYAIGYPRSYKKSLSNGIVSSADMTENVIGGGDFIINAPLSDGNSGSPVLAINENDGKFELVGIYHNRINNAEGMNLVVPVNKFKRLMR